MTHEEFVVAFNPELVGGRYIAVVDGVRQFAAEFVDGVFALTEEGKKLLRAAPEDEEAASTPRRRGRPAASE